MSLKHPAGQTGVHQPVSQRFLVVCYRRTTTFFPGHRPGVPQTPGRTQDFQKLHVLLVMCLCRSKLRKSQLARNPVLLLLVSLDKRKDKSFQNKDLLF